MDERRAGLNQNPDTINIDGVDYVRSKLQHWGSKWVTEQVPVDHPAARVKRANLDHQILENRLIR